MKKAIIIAVIAVSALTAFKAATNKSAATVDQQQGVYIFLLSKPTAEYDYLGSVKKGAAWTGGPGEMLNGILKKLKKDFPQADGIIFTTMEMDKADAIKFKD